MPCTAPRSRRFPDSSVNIGTSYDCFDSRSHTFSGRARKTRLLLRRTMDRAGFALYDKEWWHFTLRDERYPDFPVKVSEPTPGSALNRPR